MKQWALRIPKLRSSGTSDTPHTLRSQSSDPLCKLTISWAFIWLELRVKSLLEQWPANYFTGDGPIQEVLGNLESTKDILFGEVIIVVYESRCQGTNYDAKSTAGLPSRFKWKDKNPPSSNKSCFKLRDLQGLPNMVRKVTKLGKDEKDPYLNVYLFTSFHI